MEILGSAEKSNTKSLNDFKPKGTILAKVLDVYDGDTFWMAYYNEELKMPIKDKIRLARIDAAELKKKRGTIENLEQKNQRLEKAKYAKKILNELIGGKFVDVEVLPKNDPYNRIIAEVCIDGQNVSDYLLDNRIVSNF